MQIEIAVNLVLPPPNAFMIDPVDPRKMEIYLPTVLPRISFNVSPSDHKALRLKELEERLSEDVRSHFTSIIAEGWEPSQEALEAQWRAIERKRRDDERRERERREECS